MSRYSREPNCSLIIRNLADGARNEELRDVFGKFGTLKDVYIPLDYHSRRQRGFAYVQFEDPRDAKDARDELHGSLYLSTEMRIDYARGDRKTPGEMRVKERGGGRYGDDRRRDDSYRRGRHEDDHRRRNRTRSRSRNRRRRSRSLSRHNRRDRSESRSRRRYDSDDSPRKLSKRNRSQSKSRSPRRHENNGRDASDREESQRDKSGSMSASPRRSASKTNHEDVENEKQETPRREETPVRPVRVERSRSGTRSSGYRSRSNSRRSRGH